MRIFHRSSRPGHSRPRTLPPEPGRVGVPDFVGVVIPARNEESTIRAAIRSVRVATDALRAGSTPIALIVVDDGSFDRTAPRARGELGGVGSVLSVEFGCVGAARRAGFAHLLASASAYDPDRVWLATTDADSSVPPSWLTDHLRWWRDGVDAVAGMVEPFDWEDHDPAVVGRYAAMIEALGTGDGHPHVYGANLACTAAAYGAAGGFPPIDTGEDHALWRALRAAGARALAIAEAPVRTSARAVGRAPDGFAGLLSSLDPFAEIA